jgi:HlyD family secretion protein
MNTKVDLRQLAVRREEVSPTASSRRSRHLGTRLILPAVVLLGFLAVLGWAARDILLPARHVTVVPVVTTHMDVQSEGTPLFQAAGWVEPRPTATLVTALTEGVVEKLLVVEGQTIKAGDQVAQLIQADARLALQTAEADRDMRQAELEQANATLATARAALPSQLEAARSRLALLQQTLDSRTQLLEQGATPFLSVPNAKSERDAAAAKVAELEIRQGTFKAVNIRPFAELEASVKSATARLKQAETAATAAQLRLERTIVKAPMNGQVLALLARPGQRLMGQSAIGHPEASTVISMYDPNQLQIRADVRLEDVPKVEPGQRVLIYAPVSPDRPLEGEVLQITSQADIQKNTLQVKVAVKAPPAMLRPDMLVQTSFLAPAQPDANDERQTLRLLIPKQLVESAEANSFVWTADIAGKVARKTSIKLGRTSGDFVEILQGLNPSDRLIFDGRSGLSDGQRISITHGDAGVESPRGDGGARQKRLLNPAAGKDHSGKH